MQNLCLKKFKELKEILTMKKNKYSNFHINNYYIYF